MDGSGENGAVPRDGIALSHDGAELGFVPPVMGLPAHLEPSASTKGAAASATMTAKACSNREPSIAAGAGEREVPRGLAVLKSAVEARCRHGSARGGRGRRPNRGQPVNSLMSFVEISAIVFRKTALGWPTT